MYRKIIAATVVAIVVGVTGSVFAQSNTDALRTQVEALLAQIKLLQEQISSLQGQQREVRQEIRSTVQEFRSQLREGISNEEVRLLQELLSTDDDIYPEGLVTGHFGPLTKKALIRFQTKHGIESRGEVGPQTRRLLNAFLNKGQQKKADRLAISSDLLKKFDAADDVSTTTPDRTPGRGQKKLSVCHVAGNSGKSHTLVIAAPALNAHLNHGDSVGPCEGGNGNSGGTLPDITAPVISTIIATSTTTSTTHIQWVTNEAASSKVTYATSSPAASAPYVYTGANTSLVTIHDLLLQNLMASTTYYYLVTSADTAGNAATSSEQQFTTE